MAFIYLRQLKEKTLRPPAVVKMGHRKNGPERILAVVMGSERSEMGDDE